MTRLLPSLLRPLHSDEFAPVPLHPALARATDSVGRELPNIARTLVISATTYAHDRRASALALRAIDAAHGGGFFTIPEAAVHDAEASAATFNAPEPPRGTSGGEQAGSEPRARHNHQERERTGHVVDVQTHLVDPRLWVGPHAKALGQFLQLVDPDRWPGDIDPHAIDAAAWATLMFGASETAVALLTSTPGATGENVLENAQIAAVRDVTDRYAGTGRVLTHTIVHPNLGPDELDRMVEWSSGLRPSAWKVYTLAGPPTAASPTGGWFLDDTEIGTPFLERVQAVGPRIVCAHKGLGGPIPDASVAAASPRDIGPAAAAFPDLTFVVYHSGYERNPDGEERAFNAIDPSGVDRLIASCAQYGIGAHGNVYAELGSTWFLILRRPVEAAHVLGKLLAHFGPERILWGTDSTWYGSPQPLIDAFRAFTIPERMQEEFGYPALTDSVKDRILGANAARIYRLDLEALTRADPVPVDAMTPALLAAMDAARSGA
jgi:Predicted metal-dependent hydrolase of the TIM-barrel fold